MSDGDDYQVGYGNEGCLIRAAAHGPLFRSRLHFDSRQTALRRGALD